MPTYLARRWGNPDEGPDGADVYVILIADTHTQAARLSDHVLSCSKYKGYTSQVFEMSTSEFEEEKIILGPFLSSPLNAPNWKEWYRKNTDSKWYLQKPK